MNDSIDELVVYLVFFLLCIFTYDFREREREKKVSQSSHRHSDYVWRAPEGWGEGKKEINGIFA